MDPPWSADAGGGKRGAGEHYPLAGVDDIAAAVRMSGLWRDTGPALCWMWATASALVTGDAHALANRLGLRPCAGFVWAKVDDGPERDPADGLRRWWHAPPARMGLGQWTRCEHEHLLICRRGTVPVPSPAARQRSVIYAPRGEHSAKPEAAWTVIEQTTRDVWGHEHFDDDGSAPVEFFCRSPRRGWIGWGHVNGASAGVVTVGA